jgi:hypothetical protein
VGVQFADSFGSAGSLGNYQFEVSHGTGATPTDITTWHGDHNLACEAPTTLRDVHVAPEGVNPGELVWWCAPGGDPATGHMMTSLFTTGYGHVDFTPARSFSNVRRVCWDQNYTEMGGRKWTQMVVVSDATFAANGGHLDYVLPELQNDVAVGGLRLEGDTFMFRNLRGSTTTFVGQGVYEANFSGFTTTDKATRYRTCITDNENGTVRIESVVGTRVQRGSFPNGVSHVIFQDVTYDAPKDPLSTDSLATWHWDNVLVEGA